MREFFLPLSANASTRWTTMTRSSATIFLCPKFCCCPPRPAQQRACGVEEEGEVEAPMLAVQLHQRPAAARQPTRAGVDQQQRDGGGGAPVFSRVVEGLGRGWTTGNRENGEGQGPPAGAPGSPPPALATRPAPSAPPPAPATSPAPRAPPPETWWRRPRRRRRGAATATRQRLQRDEGKQCIKYGAKITPWSTGVQPTV